MPPDLRAPCCSTSPKAPAAPCAQPTGTWPAFSASHQPNRDLNDAKCSLQAIDVMLGDKAHAGSPALTATVLSGIPQYDRTHVQGCVCKPAIAGGACCPSNVGSVGLQQLAGGQHAQGMHAGHGSGMNLLSGISAGLGAVGLYSGIKVLSGAQDALRNLQAVDQQARLQGESLAVLRERVSRRPELAAQTHHIALRHTAAVQLRRDVAAARSEQRFHRWVPGRLQIVVSLGVMATSGIHLVGAVTGRAVMHGALAGTVVNALFVFYGLAMAAKNFALLWQDLARRSAPPTLAGANAAYREAHGTFSHARRMQLAHTGTAWLGVSAASLLGTAVSLGTLALPQAWALTGCLTLLAGAYAMWSNSCSRYAPHLPVSPHMQRHHVVTSAQRAGLYPLLAQQQQAIVTANAKMAADLTVLQRAQAQVERAFAPQCGSEAFSVLPRAVAQRLSRQMSLSSQDASRVQLNAVLAYLLNERELQRHRLVAEQQSLDERAKELAGLIEPTCPKKRRNLQQQAQQPSAPQDVVAQVATMLQNDGRAAVQAAARLQVADQLVAACQELQEAKGPLHISQGHARTADQERWLRVRFEVMQLCGTLRDGLSAAFVDAHGQELKQNPTPAMLPLGHIYPLPDAATKLTQDAAQEIETLFVHAFFNPRRIEAEMDCLLAMEDHDPVGAEAAGPSCAQRASAVPFAAAAASSATCCSV